MVSKRLSLRGGKGEGSVQACMSGDKKKGGGGKRRHRHSHKLSIQDAFHSVWWQHTLHTHGGRRGRTAREREGGGEDQKVLPQPFLRKTAKGGKKIARMISKISLVEVMGTALTTLPFLLSLSHVLRLVCVCVCVCESE